MKRLLVVVDFQNDFVKGTLGFEDADSISNTVIQAIEEHLKNGDDLVFTKDTHFSNYLDTTEGKNYQLFIV